MKKSLIALALMGAFSGAALAQSNVTLYGILDVNWQRIDPEVGDTQSGINGGHQSGNRFGLRGSESIGGGNSVVFTIEGGFSIDTGTNQNQNTAGCGVPSPHPVPPTVLNPCGGATQDRLFGRQAWLGFAGGWGTFVAGRTATVSSGTGAFDMIGVVDPFGTGFGDSNLGRAMSSMNSLRFDNSVLYQSPKFAGFQVGGSYSFNVSGQEIPGSSNNVNAYSVGGSWGTGPFYVAVTYDSFDFPAASDEETHLQIGATFDFKFLKLHGAYAIEEDVRSFATVGAPLVPSNVAGAEADAWMAGLTVPLFGGNILASYMERDGDAQTIPSVTVPGAFTIDERDFTTWSIGYTYPLSRRTNGYINYSDTDGEKTLNNNFTWDRKMFTIGMRHLF
jgi:GBP family porin